MTGRFLVYLEYLKKKVKDKIRHCMDLSGQFTRQVE